MAPAPTPPPARAHAPDEPLSVFGILRCARRRPGTILVATVATTAIACLLLRLREPTFRAQALIHLDTPSLGGAFGDLGRLVNLGASPAVEGEIAALEARSLAETTVAPPAGVTVPTPEAPGYDRHPGLTTIVHDSATSVFAILRRRFADPPADGRPDVVPAGRLFATVVPERDDAPRRIAISFLRPFRVRCRTPSLLATLHLGDSFPEDIDYAPGKPFTYRGATVTLVPVGDVTGRTFVLESQSEYEAVERLLRCTSAEESARGSSVLRVTVEDTDPRRAQDALAALCNNYLDEARRRSERSPDLSIEYIEKLLDEQNRAFDAAQAEILRVQQETPEVLVVPEVAESLVQRLSDLELSRVRIETGQRALAEITGKLESGDLTALALLDEGSSAGFVGSLGLTVDPLTASYVERIAQLTAQARRLEQVLEEHHPDLEALRAETTDLVADVRRQLAARRANLESELANVVAERDELRGSLLALPGRSAKLVHPLLAVRTYEELVPFLTQSLHAAEISTSAAATTADYLDRASLPTSIATPSIGRTLFVAVVLGLFLGLAIAFWREPRRGKIRGWREVEAELDLPVLATAPRHPPPPSPPAEGVLPLALLSPPGEPAAEAYRHLRARIDALSPAPGGPILFAVLGAVAGAGCSTTNRNLAIAWARNGVRTLLVDANLRAPSVQASLGLAEGPGLAEFLAGEASFAEVTRPTDLSALSVVTAGRTAKPPGDLVSRSAIDSLRHGSRDRFDRVVLDLPAVLEGAETAGACGALDSAVLVARAGRSRRWQLRACLAALALAGAPLRGVVVNATRGRGGTHPSQGGRP